MAATMRGGILVDTGYFFALCFEGDENHALAQQTLHLLDTHPVIVPWPVLYETVNTRFVKQHRAMTRFNALLMDGRTTLLDDSSYRQACYGIVQQTHRRRPLSLVDAVLRGVIEDVNVATGALLTFNPGDFHDVCRKSQVELPCQDIAGS